MIISDRIWQNQSECTWKRISAVYDKRWDIENVKQIENMFEKSVSN